MSGEETMMTNSKRKRRRPEQIVKVLADGESMLAAGKPATAVYQKLRIADALEAAVRRHIVGLGQQVTRTCG